MSARADAPTSRARRIAKLDRWLGWGGAVLVLLITLTLALPNVIAKFFGSHSGGYCQKCRVDLRAIRDALDEFAARNGRSYPTELARLVTPAADGYVYLHTTRVPRDPWKHEYVYVPPRAPGDEPVVYCVGEDGIAGTDDDLRLEDE